MTTLLIFGGIGEAVDLAEHCTRRFDFRIISALAGRTSTPRAVPGEQHSGGFGGSAGLARYLRSESIDIVIDATHPFASQISAQVAHACKAVGIPWQHLVRPPWIAQAGDRWYPVADVAAAAALLPKLARRVFYVAGRKHIACFHNLALHFVVRLIEPPEQPLPLISYELILDRGPFAVNTEVELLQQYCIDTMLCKNSGGTGGYAKIAAARQLGIPVIMIERPITLSGPTVTRAEDALGWLESQLP